MVQGKLFILMLILNLWIFFSVYLDNAYFTYLLFQMVELVPGTRVFLYQHDLDHALKVKDPNMRGTIAHGKRMAKLLMNVFFHKKDFPNATLSPLSKGRRLLNETIIDAIVSKFSLFK